MPHLSSIRGKHHFHHLQIDAFEGFEKPVQISKTKEKVASSEAAGSKDSDIVWSEEFIQEASMEFEKNIRLMMAETAGTSGNTDTNFAESLLKVSQEAAAKVFERQPDQGASFAETLRYLAEGTESLQVLYLYFLGKHQSIILKLQAEADEASLAKMLEKMAFGSDGGFGDSGSGEIGGLGDILPAMQGMLQSLLSKELLYPSIKEIVNKVGLKLELVC